MSRRDLKPRLVDQPEPGLFKKRLVPGGPKVAARIARDEDGLWQAFVNETPQGPPHTDPARAVGVLSLWSSGEPIDDTEYAYLIEMFRWAVENNPNHPFAHPSEKYDPQLSPPVF